MNVKKLFLEGFIKTFGFLFAIFVFLIIIITISDLDANANSYYEITEINNTVIESTYLEDVELFKSAYHTNTVFAPGNALINDVQADWMVYNGLLGVELFASIAFWLDVRIVSLDTVSIVDFGDLIFECGKNTIQYFDLPKFSRYYVVIWQREGGLFKIRYDYVLPKNETCLGGEFFVFQ